MIFCKKCEFEVNNTMRHSLVKNCCPCCGAALLGDIHTRRLELFKQRILEQEFSQELTTELVFDISLFMLSEFFPSTIEPSEKVEEDEVAADTEEPVAMENVEEDYNSIRDEVRSEILANMDEDLEDADADLKVARLKRIAKESKAKNPGAVVRRVAD
jgi:predicted Mrr-cat superfamily restriction endonuclease